MNRATTAEASWEWRSRSTGVLRRGPLNLHWKADGDEVGDSCSPMRFDASATWKLWVDELVQAGRFDKAAGPGWVRLYWFVRGLRIGTFATLRPDVAAGLISTPEVLERVPAGILAANQAFLDHFTWPVNADTGSPVNWLQLPVADKSWTTDRTTTGGFIQEATGWKPAPLQPLIHLPTMALSARLYWPTRQDELPQPGRLSGPIRRRMLNAARDRTGADGHRRGAPGGSLP